MRNVVVLKRTICMRTFIALRVPIYLLASHGHPRFVQSSNFLYVCTPALLVADLQIISVETRAGAIGINVHMCIYVDVGTLAGR